MANIEDVAKLVGVSKALVSRYLNNRSGVGADNRIKIAQAIETLGYRRNDIARSLVQQKTGAIGVILDSLCQTFIFDLIKGLETGGEECGYKIIFCDCMGDTQKKLSYINYLSHSRVDGLVMYGSFYKDNIIAAELSRSHFPFVMIENNVESVNTNKILIDNRDGVRQIVHHFYSKGYRDIRMVCWDMSTYAGCERYEGFKIGMEECGLTVPQKSVYCKNVLGNGFDESLDVVNQMISNKEIPDAIFFGADNLAYAAIQIFRERGIAIPDEVAISGFDNDNFTGRNIFMPRLTTVEQPLFEAGKVAIHMLSDALSNKDILSRTITLPVKLIIGETS